MVGADPERAEGGNDRWNRIRAPATLTLAVTIGIGGPGQ